MIRLLYFSISGNTRAFAKHMETYGQEQHAKDQSLPLVSIKEITDDSLFENETTPYFACVPTYLDGGNGLDSGTNEIMTNTLGEYIDHEKNSEQCLGIIGSGNKNFNWQYCLTGKQYAEKFNVPFVADYELRGTPADVERIYKQLSDIIKE